VQIEFVTKVCIGQACEYTKKKMIINKQTSLLSTHELYG